jgi:proteasome alpha subunit
MFDEPHRWVQSLENRIKYVESRLREGSPAVGLPYADGAVLFTMAPAGQQKVYEVYDRLALVGIGHPADVERLRMMAIDLAHMEGFTRSAADVTLQRLLNFGIAPQIKAAFDEMWRAPFLAKMLLAELAPNGCDPQFFTLNYDGNFVSRRKFGVAGGTAEAEELMAESLGERPPASDSLTDVLRRAMEAWAVGYYVATKEAEYEDPPMPPEQVVQETITAACDRFVLEGAVLDCRRAGRAKYRPLTANEFAAIRPK